MGMNFDQSGAPAINHDTCIGCGQCVEICPGEVLVLEEEKAHFQADRSFFGCIACGHCVAVCPTESISVSQRGMAPDDAVELPTIEAESEAGKVDVVI